MPEIDENGDIEAQRAFYERKYGIVFLDDAWSLFNIRVWQYSREGNGFGVNINSNVVLLYAKEAGVDALELLERVKNIEWSVQSEEKS